MSLTVCRRLACYGKHGLLALCLFAFDQADRMPSAVAIALTLIGNAVELGMAVTESERG